MICSPGRCIKCGVGMLYGGKVSPIYSEIVVEIDCSTHLNIAICKNCHLLPEDFDEALKAVNDAFALNSEFQIEGKINQIVKRKSYADIIKTFQGGRCLSCHKPFEDTWIISNGVMLHEGCNLPKPTPVQEKVPGFVEVKG